VGSLSVSPPRVIREDSLDGLLHRTLSLPPSLAADVMMRILEEEEVEMQRQRQEAEGEEEEEGEAEEEEGEEDAQKGADAKEGRFSP
jgi:hypothetical protein